MNEYSVGVEVGGASGTEGTVDGRPMPVDFEELQRNAAGDPDLAREILVLFEENIEGWLAALKPGLDDKAWYAASHTLKGAARGLAAWPLAELCAQAETLSSDVKAREAIRARIDEETARVRRFVGQILSGPGCS